ncbi:NnrU protein [archaeon BMS3Bbin15]|nr:NnrU protein [archaeon BMS3Bbin15]
MYIEIFFLFLCFVFIHSLTASRSFKNSLITRLEITPETYRLGYNLLSIISFLPFFLYWLTHRAESEVIVRFEGLALFLIFILKFSGISIFLAAFVQSGIGSFLGLKKSRSRLFKEGLYGIVRHPQYLGGIIFMWASQLISLLDFEVYLLLTLYLISGALLEENKLEDELEGYREYKKEVPFLIPLFSKGNR